MKKFLFILSIILSCAACTDCQDCTIENITSEVCKDDYDSNADYQLALTALEELGADCK